MNDRTVSANEVGESFYEIKEGENFVHYNMTLPIQMLFDDIISFVTIADCLE